MYEQWLDRSFGEQLMAWEAKVVANALANVFGYYALQLGADHRSLMAESRIPHRWLAQCASPYSIESPPAVAVGHASQAHIVLDPHQLPFGTNQLDLLVLAHTLERSARPRQVVREAERVLLPEGRLVIAGLNPWNLRVAWHQMQHKRMRRCEESQSRSATPVRALPALQLCDWLELLGFEIDYIQMGGASSNLSQGPQEIRGSLAAEAAGKRYGPFWARAYVVVATKKVAGMRLVMPSWQVKKMSKGLAVQKVHRAGEMNAYPAKAEVQVMRKHPHES